jgi:dTDP-4-dehydrorhamnose reductase
MKSRIVVLGATGQVGLELRQLSLLYPQYDFFFLGRDKLNLALHNSINRKLEEYEPDVIINAAAYTAVDQAEADMEIANAINHLAVEQLALYAKQHDIQLVHISTDYVFSGSKKSPYVESDQTEPLSVYGRTKLRGEQAIFHIEPKRTIIVRTSAVYSEFGANFVKTIAQKAREFSELRVVNDQVISPTNAKDLAKIILDILPFIQNHQPEIYHYSNAGECSWFDMAQFIVSNLGGVCKVDPVPSSEYPSVAKRPSHSVLCCDKIKTAFRLDIPHWQDSLEQHRLRENRLVHNE